MPVLRLAQRLTLAIFCADFLTMLAMNCLRLRPFVTPWIFFPVAALCLTVSEGSPMEGDSRLSPAYVRRLTRAALVFGGLCAAVRWASLVEPFRHQVSAAVGDDLWHLQELNSLVNSPSYPARSSFAPEKYLSFYYAPWMPAVALYFALPFHFITLTTALFAVNAVYDLLLPLTLLGIALPLAKSHRQMSWAVYLVVLWSGVQSFYSVQQPLHDDSWPLRDLFGLNLQFSNFATLMIWVVHHLCAAVALLLAYSIWHNETKPLRVAFCSVLLAFSVYSSAFVLLGAAPLLLLLLSIREARKRPWRVAACLGLAGTLAAPLLWMYLRKPEGIGFQMPLHHDHWIHLPNWQVLPAVDRHYGAVSGFALFLILLLVQFFFVPWFLVRGWSLMTRSERALTVISVAYLLSTYFVGFTGANNYCMRGAIVPVIVLCWIASAHLPHPGSLVGIFLIAGSMGTWQTLEYQLLRSAALYLKPPPYLADSSALLILNQDRSRTQIDLTAVLGMRRYPAELPYYVQKMPLEPWPIQTQPDKELQTLGPAGPWSWQGR